MTVGTSWMRNDNGAVVKVLWTKGLSIVFEDVVGHRYKVSQKKFRKLFTELVKK